jgi:hypothetical protein
MTTLGEHMTTGGPGGGTPTSGSTTGSPSGQHDVDPPVNPFLALRVTFGMLLGEDDFRVLMGNPRGKQMLHSAWLHGRGVVWGMGVEQEGDQLVVSPGLAVDGHGRELRLDVRWCKPLRKWAEEWQKAYPPGKEDAGRSRRTVTAWLLAEFGGCLDRPVPALADPCDVTRKHDDYSRVVESVRLLIRPEPPYLPHPYRRVRMLLGLQPITDDSAGEQAADAIESVNAANPPKRAVELLRQLRLLAARDATDWPPRPEEGEPPPGMFPVTEREAGVVLARLSVEITEQDDCVGFGQVTVDPDVRSVLIPTATIQELAAGLAPGVLGADTREDAGGPRLVTGSVHWSRGNSRVSFWVTKPIAPGSGESGIEVNSLSQAGRGWSPAHIDGVTLQDNGLRVVVELDNPPAYRWGRLLIRGTGPTPLFGRDPLVPFAGVEGGPPGTEHDGHDAAHVTDLSASEESRTES